MKKSWLKVKLGEVLKEHDNSVPVAELNEVNLAGVYSFSRGLFKRGPISPGETSYKSYNRLVTDDFVISTPKAWEGALALVTPEFDGWYLSPVFPTFRFNRERLLPKFLEWYCKREPVWGELQRKSRGIGARRESVHPEQFLSLEIPLPPLAEQRRVVARIEELATNIDESHKVRNQAAEETDGILPSRLNEFIRAAERDAVPARAIGSFTRFDRYGPRFYDQSYSETGTPIVRATDIDDHGRIDFSRMPKLEIAADQVTKMKAEIGDLLIVRSGSIGLSAVFKNPDIACIPAAYLIQFRFDDSADPHFVRYCLKAPSIQQELVGRGTTVQNLNAKKIKSTAIPFPPLAQQRQIVAELDALQAEVDALKRLQAETAAELDALLPAILDKAFKGEL